MNIAHQWLDVQGHDARRMLFNTSTPHRFILCPTFKSEVAAGTNRQELAKNSMIHAICVRTPLRAAISKTVGGIYVLTEKYREGKILQALQVKHIQSIEWIALLLLVVVLIFSKWKSAISEIRSFDQRGQTSLALGPGIKVNYRYF